MPAPTFYDPNSPDEQPVPLPSAPLQIVSETPSIVLQPPLTRRGTGPGLIVTLPPSLALQANPKGKPLDPEPVQKWAEEGFTVVGITATETELEDAVVKALDALAGLEEVDIKDKVAVLGTLIPSLVDACMLRLIPFPSSVRGTPLVYDLLHCIQES